MATLGFKIGAASGGGATAAAAIGGGLYLGSDSSSENITIEDPSVDKESKEQNSKQKEKPELNKGKKTWRKSTSKTPRWVPEIKSALETPVISSTSYSDKFEERYSLFLPSTSIDASSDENTKNDRLAWWEDKYELLIEDKNTKLDTLDTKFKEVTQAFDDSDSKALNQVCKSIYSSNESDTKTYTYSLEKWEELPITEEQRIISNLERNFWRFCSSLMTKPTNMVESKEASTDSGHIGYPDTTGYILAATKAGFNDEFWKIKNKWFLDLWDAGKVDAKFKSYVEQKGEAVKEENKISLRKVCSNTPTINLSAAELTKEEVAKYCAFSERFYKQS